MSFDWLKQRHMTLLGKYYRPGDTISLVIVATMEATITPEGQVKFTSALDQLIYV